VADFRLDAAGHTECILATIRTKREHKMPDKPTRADRDGREAFRFASGSPFHRVLSVSGMVKSPLSSTKTAVPTVEL
jgi:hypothetical protein